jgi:hypothetical protein
MENGTMHKLSAPLWAIAAALWVLAGAAVIGSMKISQAQSAIQHEIEALRRWTRP